MEASGPSWPPPEVISFYARGIELDRLAEGAGRLELARTQEILRRHLRPASRVLDVGGGPGTYAAWLAADGHDVHLVDPVPLHVEQAAAVAAEGRRSFSVSLGDARELEWDDASFDAVLILGPLYHLPERADRLAALREGHRVLRPGGLVAAAAISRFAGLLDGLSKGWITDPDRLASVQAGLESGRNPPRGEFFTDAFFHLPEELLTEVEEVGFSGVSVLGIEGPAAWLPDLEERWRNPDFRERTLWAARRLEAEPHLVALSAHLMALGTR